jgi:hypothetical protein
MSAVDGESGQGASRLSALRTKVELWVAVVLMAFGFLGGVLVSGMDSGPAQQGPPSGTQQQFPQEGFQVAPPLTEEQLSGEMPAGHVPVDSGASQTPSGTGSPAP